MAQVSFAGAQQPINVVDQNLVKFGTPDALQPYAWSWLTPTGHDVDAPSAPASPTTPPARR
jgi:hypothetical protein